MIRLLKEEDRDSVLEYLYKDLSYNIFPIGDIETFGFSTDFQRVYAEFDKKGRYLSILLRYRENAIYYSDQVRFNSDYLVIMENDKFDYISGKSELMDLIAPYLNDFTRKKTYFCEAKSFDSNINYDFTQIKELKTEADCSKLYDLLFQIKEFGYQKKKKEEFIKNKLESLKMGTNLFIEENNIVVSSVATTAETTKNAMVVAVATDKDYRKRGHATNLMQYLMDLYINVKKKSLCLFYNNSEAGKIYLRLGFKYIGNWDMFERKNI